MYKTGDKVRHVESRNAVDGTFDGSSEQPGKQVGTILRVYEILGVSVCDLAFGDGSEDHQIPLEELKPV